jgi:hypothetical protein
MEGAFEYNPVNIDQGVYKDEISSMQNSQSRLCPFVSKPFENCYCTSTSSMVVESTINFCGGNFKQCEIFRENKGNG